MSFQKPREANQSHLEAPSFYLGARRYLEEPGEYPEAPSCHQEALSGNPMLPKGHWQPQVVTEWSLGANEWLLRAIGWLMEPLDA